MGAHNSRTVSINLVNNQLISSTQTFTNNCFVAQEGTQNVSINGNADYNTNLVQSFQDGKSNCNLCIKALGDLQQRRLDIEQTAKTLDVSYEIQSSSFGSLTSSTSSGSSDDADIVLKNPCDLVCRSVVADSVSQSLQIKSTQDCQVSNSVSNDVSQEMTAKIQQSLKNQQDVFGQFLSSFSNSDLNVETNINTTIQANVDQKFVQELVTSVNATQTVSVNPGSASVFISGFSQSFEATTTSNLEAVNQIYNEIKSSASYSIAQSLLNKQDTVGDLTKNLNSALTNVADLIDNLATYAIICVCCFVLGIFLVLGIMYLFSDKYKSRVNDILEFHGDKVLDFANRGGNGTFAQPASWKQV